MTSQQVHTAPTGGARVVPLPTVADGEFTALPTPRDATRGARSATVRLQLDCGPEAAAAARAAISMLDGCAPRELLDDARLLTSEVVTNAVRHSGAAEGSVVDVEVAATADHVAVGVSDQGNGFVPRARTKGQSEGSGWGLHLVERLASSWGVEAEPQPRVWFELQVAA